jgi:phenylacetate-CoA ligase
VVPLSGGQTEKQVQLILDFKPEIIMVTPSYLLTIAEELERRGVNARNCPLRIGILGAEPWSEAMRQEIEQRLGLAAVDIYGLSEVMGPGVASECVETKDGLVLWEDHFYPEIIDPETGAVLPEGTEGELVLTSLTKEAFPVIRYRTRDRTRLLSPTARAMRRLARINGRTDDMLIIRGVNVFPSQLEELILRSGAFSPAYLIEVEREGHLDRLTINIEWARASAVDGPAEEAAASALVHQVKSSVGISVHVRILAPGTLERSVGKARRVIDRRQQR